MQASHQNPPLIESLFFATPGSTGLDLSPTSQYVLMPNSGVQVIPTGVYGPWPQSTEGLILQRSSVTIRGLQVYLGVIDEDYAGEIMKMAWAPMPL
jgi:dUTPase